MIPQFRQNVAPMFVRHPDVDVAVHYYDTDPANMPPKVMEAHYENGDVIVFKNANLVMSEEDWRLFNGINIAATSDNFVKKAKLKHLFQPLTPDGWDKHVLSKMTTNYVKAGFIQNMMAQVSQQVRDYVKLWFPNLKVLDDQSITWRLTPTESEDMHYDSYGVTPNDYHNVRVFINLDDKPRVWGVSHKVQDVIAQHRDLMAPFKDKHPNLFNAALNTKLPWDQISRHFISFAPLNMWLVNSQIVAHEIIYGRRMLAATIACDPASMKWPEKHFVNVVRKAWE